MTLKDGRSHHGEMALAGPGDRRYHMLAWTAPMATAAGKLVQVMLILLDITQIRELQSNLASLGLMIGSISHSIKGVLTGLDAGVYLRGGAAAAPAVDSEGRSKDEPRSWRSPICTGTRVFGAPPKAALSESETTRYLPSLTEEIAYITTKKASSSVTRSP